VFQLMFRGVRSLAVPQNHSGPLNTGLNTSGSVEQVRDMALRHPMRHLKAGADVTIAVSGKMPPASQTRKPRSAQCAQGANPRAMHENAQGVVVDGDSTGVTDRAEHLAERSFGETRGE